MEDAVAFSTAHVLSGGLPFAGLVVADDSDTEWGFDYRRSYPMFGIERTRLPAASRLFPSAPA